MIHKRCHVLLMESETSNALESGWTFGFLPDWQCASQGIGPASMSISLILALNTVNTEGRKSYNRFRIKMLPYIWRISIEINIISLISVSGFALRKLEQFLCLGVGGFLTNISRCPFTPVTKHKKPQNSGGSHPLGVTLMLARTSTQIWQNMVFCLELQGFCILQQWHHAQIRKYSGANAPVFCPR